MSEVPTPQSESTAIEIVRREGSARSYKCVDNGLTAGDIAFFPNSSGIAKAIGGTSGGISNIAGVALYTTVSGARAVTIKGVVRCKWDGVTAGVLGQGIGASTTNSGWFEITPAIASSGSYLVIGRYVDTSVGTLAAANSGTLVAVELL